MRESGEDIGEVRLMVGKCFNGGFSMGRIGGFYSRLWLRLHAIERSPCKADGRRVKVCVGAGSSLLRL